MLNKFIRLIQRKWNQFPKSGNIELHTSTQNSYPLGNELSIIKNSDYKVYIKEECDRIISNLTNDILKENVIIDLYDLDQINIFLFSTFIQKTEINTNIDLFTIIRDENNIKNKYDNMNKYIHYNCIDNADNIIDYENNTFAGGSRRVEIIDEFNKVKLQHYLVIMKKKLLIFSLFINK